MVDDISAYSEGRPNPEDRIGSVRELSEHLRTCATDHMFDWTLACHPSQVCDEWHLSARVSLIP